MREIIWLLLNITARTGFFLTIVLWLTSQFCCLEARVSLAGGALNVATNRHGVVLVAQRSAGNTATIAVVEEADVADDVMLLEPPDPIAPFAWNGQIPTLTLPGVVLIYSRLAVVLAIRHLHVVAVFGFFAGMLYLIRQRHAATAQQATAN